MQERFQSWSVEVTADTTGLRQSLEQASRFGDQFAARMTSAFEQVAIRGRKLEDVARSLALSLSQIALKAAFKPIESALGDAFGGLFAGLAGAIGGGASPLPLPFAKGGVIAAPATFPLTGGRMGLAGERGAEAILPLARGPDGRLGVAASAGAGAGLTINFNVTSPDVAGFRRSQSQIAAMLSRAIGGGERNL